MSNTRIKYPEFSDYFNTIIDNINDNVIDDYLYYSYHNEISELIHNLHFRDIPVTKATVIVESFFSIFGKFLPIKKNID